MTASESTPQGCGPIVGSAEVKCCSRLDKSGHDIYVNCIGEILVWRSVGRCMICHVGVVAGMVKRCHPVQVKGINIHIDPCSKEPHYVHAAEASSQMQHRDFLQSARALIQIQRCCCYQELKNLYMATLGCEVKTRPQLDPLRVGAVPELHPGGINLATARVRVQCSVHRLDCSQTSSWSTHGRPFLRYLSSCSLVDL
ncbi:hypothetical protein BBJ29_005847 [Phytophthora kernoviae]|uniref:Uncharacterized protein n=1 Tax=Phytophthora kernoviae TaxID=325452 RepID=A0A3F2RH97_9STRA|nr:hypothetical protein BBJ29_005847 [Phytophthora kernoviae]RLN56871.1 hypothetical protein BBP00_00007797 [Phytophthora kernoviae]